MILTDYSLDGGDLTMAAAALTGLTLATIGAYMGWRKSKPRPTPTTLPAGDEPTLPAIDPDYQHPETVGTVFDIRVCRDCGTNVAPGDQSAHTQWHEEQQGTTPQPPEAGTE